MGELDFEENQQKEMAEKRREKEAKAQQKAQQIAEQTADESTESDVKHRSKPVSKASPNPQQNPQQSVSERGCQTETPKSEKGVLSIRNSDCRVLSEGKNSDERTRTADLSLMKTPL
jgi:hypothetical protein